MDEKATMEKDEVLPSAAAVPGNECPLHAHHRLSGVRGPPPLYQEPGGFGRGH